MNKIDFEKAFKEYFANAPGNYVKKEIALRPELEGMRIFDEPLAGYASASDPYFTEAKKPDVIGPHFMTPLEWLGGAETVISVFFPLTEQIRAANRRDMSWPADEWLHGRIEGQAFQNSVCGFLEDYFKKEGFAAIAPLTDPRFGKKGSTVTDKTEQGFYTSNWSERHAAFAAGLGTFGLSKGLITRKGVAGRYISIITTVFFEPDKRPYSGIYDYCSFCYACVRNCPAKAISKEKGKIHYLCSDFLDSIREKHPPYYGCGKCQVNVPCEGKAPNSVAAK